MLLKLLLLKILLRIKVVIYYLDISWLRPKAEVGRQYMLIGEIKQTYGPLAVVAHKEVLRVVQALVHHRCQLVM